MYYDHKLISSFIDDYSNDEVGATLISRASKACWGKSTIIIKKKATVPSSNLVICSNEVISDIKVEGRNKSEVHMKFSVLDLGEESLPSSDNKEQLLNRILELGKVLRKYIPSFFGLMLQASDKYITQEEIKKYQDITKHERLSNILKNLSNVYDMLGQFCESTVLDKPKSLRKLNVSPLTLKSELVHKFKTPDQLSLILIKQDIHMVETVHNNEKGVAFAYQDLATFPWLVETMNYSQNGTPAYIKMRSRKMAGESGEGRRVAFLRFSILRPGTVQKLNEHLKECDPAVLVANYFEQLYNQYQNSRMKRQLKAVNFVQKAFKELSINEESVDKLSCPKCGKKLKSISGLKNHLNKCKNKK